MTITEMKTALMEGKTTSSALVAAAKAAYEADLKEAVPLNAFLEIYDDVEAKAQAADDEIKAAREKGSLEELFQKKPLLGIPFANKDNISGRGKKLTCASRILTGYVAPYNATVIDRLEAAGAIPMGRCNMDEFAMGSSTEYSIYGPTHNPVNRAYVSGGSSGGSAAAVAAGWVPFGLGTETGGSVRLPASYCGVYGLKPTYGVLSRWGVVAYGSSLDQVGIMGRTVADIALPLGVMAGEDFRDDTSIDLPEAGSLGCFGLRPRNDGDTAPYTKGRADTVIANGLLMADNAKQPLKVAIPKQFIETDGLDDDVRAVFDQTCQWFKEHGAQVDVVDLPILDAAIASYYVIALSEAASNLSRFDGVRYGARVDAGHGYDELYVDTRSSGFGPEVKRRIVIGNYVLSEQFSGDTYKKGMTVRARIQREMSKLFQTYNVVLCPTCPTPAFKLGEKVDNPLEMYLSDLYTTFVNLARIPSISVPAGVAPHHGNMPVGVQFAGAMGSEVRLLQLAAEWERH